MLREVLKNTEVKKAILFGSYAKKEPNQNSDIDILIDSNGKIKGLKFFAIIDMIREKFDKERKTINACVFNLSQIGELVGKLSEDTVNRVAPKNC